MSGATRVDFVVAGVQKAGTTALAGYLGRHPQLWLPPEKELHFFNNESLFASGQPDYEAYHRHFAEAPPGRLLGEATPAYIYWRRAIPRLHAYNPDMRVIVLLRNPIERAFSHWYMERRRGRETLDFEEALRAEPGRLRSASMMEALFFSYRERGYYAEQLRRLWRSFPPEQTLVLRMEWLRDDPAGTVGAACRFLGVAPQPGLRRELVHAQQYDEALPARAWASLAEAYCRDISELERLLGWDCSDWLARPDGEPDKTDGLLSRC